MKKILLQIFTLTIFLTSGVSEKEQNAASKVAALWNAENSSIGHTKTADTEKGTHNVMVVTLKNLKTVDDKYSKDKITSASALTLIENLRKEDYQDFDQIKIIIENNSTSYEKTYEINKLVNTILLLNEITQFFDYSSTRDTLNLKWIISSKDIQDSGLISILQANNQIDSTYGKLNHITITGFRYDHVNKTNEPAIVAWTDVFNGNTLTNYSFYISEESKKIIYIGINDGEK